jgi:hypothetical protein
VIGPHPLRIGAGRDDAVRPDEIDVVAADLLHRIHDLLRGFFDQSVPPFCSSRILSCAPDLLRRKARLSAAFCAGQAYVTYNIVIGNIPEHSIICNIYLSRSAAYDMTMLNVFRKSDSCTCCREDKTLKVVIAIDSLKGSLTSLEAGDAIRAGVCKADPGAQIIVRPLADGGEGTVEALTLGMGGTLQSAEVTGPLGERVTAQYGILDDGQTAVMEMSAAAGITLVPKRSAIRCTPPPTVLAR